MIIVDENYENVIFFLVKIAIARISYYLRAIVNYNKIPGNRKYVISVTARVGRGGGGS